MATILLVEDAAELVVELALAARVVPRRTQGLGEGLHVGRRYRLVAALQASHVLRAERRRVQAGHQRRPARSAHAGGRESDAHGPRRANPEGAEGE